MPAEAVTAQKMTLYDLLCCNTDTFSAMVQIHELIDFNPDPALEIYSTSFFFNLKHLLPF
jgi:hypothetical protein